jgi:hypothetical protein
MLSQKQSHADENTTLQLSLDDLRELEEAFNHFNCENVPLTVDRNTDRCIATGLSLNQLQAEHFPLPTLSHKLHQFRVLLPTTQTYFIVRGIRPAWFSKYKNVVVFTGLASHIGTKRALAPGDPNVLRALSLPDA